MGKETRSRAWTVVVYPESCPENWVEIMNAWNIEYVISPLHDKDLNGAEEEKKAHWHVLLKFEGMKSIEQVSELVKPLNCPRPQRVHSPKSLVRYFLHLDHPDKHRYSASDLRIYGGIDIQDLLKPGTSERYTIIADMMDFVDNNGIEEYCDLVRYARDKERETWFPVLCDTATYLLSTYIKSQRFKNTD